MTVKTSQLIKFNYENSKKTMLLLLISLSIIQQLPVIKDLFYSQTRILLYMGFGLLSLLSLLNVKDFLKIPFVLFFGYTLSYSVFVSLLEIYYVGVNNSLLELLVPFGILLCSLNAQFSKKSLGIVMVVYVTLSLILGVSSVLYYGSGFTIAEQYFLEGKNQIGPMLGISIIIMGYWVIYPKTYAFKYGNRLIYSVVFLSLVTSLLVIRNRSSLLGVAVISFIVVSSLLKNQVTLQKIILFSIISIGLIMAFLNGSLDPIVTFISNSLFLNYKVTDLNSVSAGRTDAYVDAIKFISQHPFFGELGNSQQFLDVPHNYVLNKWVNYGLVFSFPFIIFYAYLWALVFKRLLFNRTNLALPFWVLAFSLIVSLFEYQFPYGPGVSQLFIWFLLGQYYRGIYSSPTIEVDLKGRKLKLMKIHLS